MRSLLTAKFSATAEFKELSPPNACQTILSNQPPDVVSLLDRRSGLIVERSGTLWVGVMPRGADCGIRWKLDNLKQKSCGSACQSDRRGRVDIASGEGGAMVVIGVWGRRWTGG
ncbi:hypothetical protein TNCT_655451 [Trichonephila clavata]|uniref:Uncharacterized protein n=1 Tax=Trichonephila clavata TaxID=2740835 RepID=A0A8X6FG56_TRICU|nr:hypothetical protein TNCT_655451 [Trichonephila clavata]